jgi:hypothetical protein
MWKVFSGKYISHVYVKKKNNFKKIPNLTL